MPITWEPVTNVLYSLAKSTGNDVPVPAFMKVRWQDGTTNMYSIDSYRAMKNVSGSPNIIEQILPVSHTNRLDITNDISVSKDSSVEGVKVSLVNNNTQHYALITWTTIIVGGVGGRPTEHATVVEPSTSRLVFIDVVPISIGEVFGAVTLATADKDTITKAEVDALLPIH